MALLLGVGCTSVRRLDDSDLAYRVVYPTVAFEILRDNPDTLILDLRPVSDFAGPEGHIVNAINIPVEQLRDRVAELKAFAGRTYIVYCDEVSSCAEDGVRFLLGQGYTEAVLMDHGLAGWQAAGFGTIVEDTEGPQPGIW